LQEQFASRDAATACLIRLSLRNGGAARIKAARSSGDPGSETLPLSQLVRLAAELGLEAQWMRLDWQGLKTAVSARPLLIVRNNSEVVVVTGRGRSGAEEVSVWDPKHDGVVFFASREDFERTCSGHALLITARDAGANIFAASPSSPTVPERQTPRGKSRTALRLCLDIAVASLVASAGIVLFMLTPPNAGQTAGPGTSGRVESAGGRQTAPSGGAVAAAPSVPLPEAAAISPTRRSSGSRDHHEPDDIAPKPESGQPAQPHL